MMCADVWHRTAPHGGVAAESAREFAAVPLVTGKTRAVGCSKTARTTSWRWAVRSSPPYARAEPVLAAWTAARISGATPAALSLRNSITRLLCPSRPRTNERAHLGPQCSPSASIRPNTQVQSSGCVFPPRGVAAERDRGHLVDVVRTARSGPGVGPATVRLRSLHLGRAARTHAPLLGESLGLGDVQSRPLRPRAPARVALEICRLIAGASYRRDPAEAEADVDQVVGGQRPRLDALAGQSQPHGPGVGTGGLEELLDIPH